MRCYQNFYNLYSLYLVSINQSWIYIAHKRKASTSVSVTSLCQHTKMVFTDEDKATRPSRFSWVNRHYGDKHLRKEFPTKYWSLRGLNKFLKQIDKTSNDWKVPVGCGWCAAMKALNSLSSWQTLIQEENHITAQPNIEPPFMHKFCQFYPFIHLLGDPAIETDWRCHHDDIRMSHYKVTVKAVHVMVILIALNKVFNKVLSLALVRKFLYINPILTELYR